MRSRGTDRRRGTPAPARPEGRANGPWFWVAAAFLLLVFLMGGSSQVAVLSLPILRPVSALLLAAVLVSLRREDLAAHRTPVILLAIVIVAVLAHLVPLPPSLWMQLPHRGLAIAAVDSAGVAGEWRPLSLSPTATRNAAYSLLVPAAMLALALRLTPAERCRLPLVVLGLGAAGILLGVLQVSASPSKTFYLYRLSTQFVPNGFFANPNHNAAFLACLLPLTAFAASRLDGRIGRVRKELVVDVVAALVIVLTILLAGSRAGLALGAIGVAAMPLARLSPRAAAARAGAVPAIALIGVGLAAIVGVAIAMGRAAAVHRLLAGNATEDLRLRVWPVIAREAADYFPAGAGWGSFVETFQIAEPYRLLKPTFLNHAHNDWLEVVMNGGVIGAALLAFVLGWWLRSLIRMSAADRRGAALGWAGLATLLLLGLSSLVDYPLRTPCLQALFVLSWLWIGDALHPEIDGNRGQ